VVLVLVLVLLRVRVLLLRLLLLLLLGLGLEMGGAIQAWALMVNGGRRRQVRHRQV
jgi:hypothetical protein